MFKYMNQVGVNPLLAASWRGQCMLVFLIPCAYIEIISNDKRVEWNVRKSDMTYPLFVHVLIGMLNANILKRST
jgi:hypothetical protein